MCHAATNGCKLWGHPEQGGVPFFEMKGTESDLEAVVRVGQGLVEFIEPDSTVSEIPEMQVAADSAQPGLWGLTRVAEAKKPRQGSGVTVFIFDTGVRTSHVD